MREYEIVKIGNRHSIKGELFSQDIIEIYPLDEFKYNQFFADQIYTFIKGVDEDLSGAFPIIAFDDGEYAGCVAVFAIMEKVDEDGETVILSVGEKARKIADEYCKDAFYRGKSKVEQWSELMDIAEKNDLLSEMVDFVDLKIGFH